jgi:hypothetical protein
VGVLVLAATVARWRDRLVLAGTVAAGVVVSIVVFVTVARTGFPMQGRYVLPVVVAVPLLAGELVFRNRGRLPILLRIPLLALVAVVAAAGHFAGWAVNARRSAVGVLGPLWFSGQSQWQPPLGWGPWLLVSVIGSFLLVAAGLMAYAERPVAALVVPAGAPDDRPASRTRRLPGR